MERIGGPETAKTAELSKGMQWLRLLGEDYVAMADRETGRVDESGQPIRVGDFHQLCEEDAEPIFVYLGDQDPDSAEYAQALGVAREMFALYFGTPGQTE